MKLYLLIFLAICIAQCIQAKRGVVGPGTPSCPDDPFAPLVRCTYLHLCNSDFGCPSINDEYNNICCPWNCAYRCLNPSNPPPYIY